jgi:uncharacterized protein YdaU (DUF1376 family)
MYYYKFNIADWHLATSHLSLEEEAIYFKLINYYYDTETPIPKETQTVIRRLRLGSYMDTVQVILDEFFELSTDGWHHKRCDDEIHAYHLKAEKNQIVGKLGGRPKKNKDLDNNPKETQTVSEDNPNITLTKNHKPLTNNHKPIDTPSGVTESVWNDYLKIRKAKKLPITETAIKGLQREAVKANMTFEQVLQMCCERGWVGFKAEWAESAKAQIQANNELPLGTDKQIEHAYKVECGGDPSKANFRSYQDMRKFIQDFRDKSKRALQ